MIVDFRKWKFYWKLQLLEGIPELEKKKKAGKRKTHLVVVKAINFFEKVKLLLGHAQYFTQL